MKVLDRFPRLIVDLDKALWNLGLHASFRVVQLCVIKGGKKTFVNIDLTDDNNHGQIVEMTVMRNTKDRTHGIEFTPDMPVSEDERDVVGAFELEL